MNLVFIDTETTGLNYRIHGIIEVGYAYEDGPVKSFVLPHGHLMADASPKALEVNHYYERNLGDQPIATPNEVAAFLDAIDGAQIVGANIRFDARMLENTFEFEEEPWHYRLFDFSSWASGRLGWNEVKGMSEISKALAERGHELPLPDHTAGGDVDSMRSMFRILKAL